MTHTEQLTQAIKQQILQLGFSQVGVFSVQSLAANNQQLPEGQQVAQWIDQGYHADMDWMVTHLDKRITPESLMPGTQSILCLLINYYTEEAPNPPHGAVKIARYAQGSDYHTILKKKLKKLTQYIETVSPGVQYRYFTDSAPVLERPLAIRTGLGWQGKNGMLISPGLGSFFFIAEVFLDIPLTPDEPFTANHCGTCRRCIEACPTEAIVADSVIDSNQCIAYWTIEAKHETFPDAIRDNLSDWAFGCDICQEVCPWNIKFARPNNEAAFQARPWNVAPLPEEILALDQATFDERYANSPVKRTKLAGLKRNVREILKSRAKSGQ